MLHDSSDHDGFRRLEEAFHRAQSTPDEERAALIEASFPDEPVLRRRLERMLASAGAPSSTRSLGQEVLEQAQEDALAEEVGAQRPKGRRVGQQLGRYRLLEFRGEGGFGEVYLAEQMEPIRRRVAVKVLRMERSSGGSPARFRSEVASLARLEHPGIARIYDAGEALPDPADGLDAGERPVSFIAMEFVDGTPITIDAALRGTSLRDRIALVAEIADAMQHAHQRGIIHRDIKPSNVLVTTDERGPRAKIIDFGIAKAIGATDAASTVRADLAAPVEASALGTDLLGTPRYMSPEQADLRRGGDVDTRTDIYSLGLILTELIEGTGHSGRRTLSRGQREDLERVRRMALDPDRERRYTSAAAFADDLRRVLRCEAVSAGPATVGYRLARWFGRHRATSAATAIAALTLLGGAVATTLGLVEAREQAARADAVNGFLADVLTTVHPERRGADVPLSSVMDDASARAGTRFAGQPLVEGETRVLLGGAYASLWRTDAAVREYRAALALFEANAGPDDPQAVRVRIRLARALLGMGKPKDAAGASEGLREQVGRVFGDRSREAAEVEILAARIAAARAQPEAAEQGIAAAAAWIEIEFADDTELLLTLLSERIRVMRRVALHRGLDNPDAPRALAEAHRLSRRLVDLATTQGTPDSIQSFVALAEYAISSLDVERFPEALAASDRLLAASEGKLSACHDARLDAVRARGTALRAMGDAEAGLEWKLRALECMRTVADAGSMAVVAQEFDIIAYFDYAGRFEDSERQCRMVAEAVAQFGPLGQQLAQGAEVYRARALSRLGRSDEAEAIFERLLADDAIAADGRTSARLRAFWAAHLARSGRADEARAAIAASFEALPASYGGTWKGHLDDRLVVLIETYELLGDDHAADDTRRTRDALLTRLRSTT
jgi:tetratricopeptide (TPR) repeat protein